MAHQDEAGSSRRVDGHKMKEESVVGTYRLFPEPGQTHMAHLYDIVSTHQPQMLPNQPVTQFPFQAMQQTTCLDDSIDIMAVQLAYLCALQDPDEITAVAPLQQSPQHLKNHYADYIGQMPQYSRGSQHSRQENINHSGTVQGMSGSRMDTTFRIISSRGQIADLCAHPHGSRRIQRALETATHEEVVMVYREVIPVARRLSTDVFGNYAIQKLLERGPLRCQMEFISELIGHVVPLSHHIYGCRVIQKAFEVADYGLQIEMANEFRGEVLKCTHNQFAHHVLERCMECLPARRIKFIFKSFCSKAEEFSTTPYGCHIMQKVLALCDDAEIRHKLVSEIVEAAVELASDPFGNYVVQHVVAHGAPVERSAIVNKFTGHVVSMSHQKFASNVIEKCLMVGSFQDRQLIATEILSAGGFHRRRLGEMMRHMYASFVIQKLVRSTDEGQLRVLAEVAHRNRATIVKCPQGRHVIANIQRALKTSREGYVLKEKGMSWPSCR